jgi:hypothetical protein
MEKLVKKKKKNIFMEIFCHRNHFILLFHKFIIIFYYYCMFEAQTNTEAQSKNVMHKFANINYCRTHDFFYTFCDELLKGKKL